MRRGGETRQTNLAAEGEPAEQAELARRAAAGDRASQQGLFERLLPLVHKHVGFTLGFGPLVEDAVQDSMLEIHRALPSFRHQSSVSTWALAIATRVAIRRARRERRHMAVDLDTPGLALYSSASASQDGELALLVKALGRIAIKKRVAFVLMAVLDCSATEAGEILGTSPNTAASRYRHAREELLEIVQPDRKF